MCHACGVCGPFVFFKQKTAYEVRISGWSSDVCSSDLLPFGKPGQIADMIDALGGALPGQLLVLALEGRQLQGFEIVGKQELGGLGAHAASSPSTLPSRRM